MSTIIDTLHNDHKNIARLLGLLNKQVNIIEAGDNPDYRLMTNVMDYLVNYPDVHHHPHEDLVFDALKEKDINTADTIDEIVSEHQSMAVDSQTILDGLKQLQGNAILSRDEIVKKIRVYIQTYYAHMDKEEGELFSKARKLLTDEDWQTVQSEMKMIDDPLFGAILEEEYADLYKAIFSGT